MRVKRARGQAATWSYRPAAPNTALEATGHSVGFFPARVSVPVARASAWALDAQGMKEKAGETCRGQDVQFLYGIVKGKRW